MVDLDPTSNEIRPAVDEPYARIGLAIVRLTIGAMFVWVFFENLGKGLYTPAGYAGLINYYIQHDHAPAVWKGVMAVAASHCNARPFRFLPPIWCGPKPRPFVEPFSGSARS